MLESLLTEFHLEQIVVRIVEYDRGATLPLVLASHGQFAAG